MNDESRATDDGRIIQAPPQEPTAASPATGCGCIAGGCGCLLIVVAGVVVAIGYIAVLWIEPGSSP